MYELLTQTLLHNYTGVSVLLAISYKMHSDTCVFERDLSGTTMVVDTYIMPQAAVHVTNFFNML